MSVDLGDLLRRSAADPSAPLDPEEVWVRGRRRRRRRLVATSTAGVLAAGLLVAVPVTLAGVDPQPVIEPIGQDEPAEDETTGIDEPVDAAEETTDDAPPVETAEPPDGPTADELLALEQQAAREAAEELERRLAEASEAEETAEAVGPDPERLADPCAVHRGGEMRAFIDVVAPVGGQQVGSQIELVGCSSVYEATVSYRLRDADGAVLLEWFTTATAGGPEIGEFRETIEVPTTGDLLLEVYWVDAADGSDRDVQTVAITAG